MSRVSSKCRSEPRTFCLLLGPRNPLLCRHNFTLTLQETRRRKVASFLPKTGLTTTYTSRRNVSFLQKYCAGKSLKRGLLRSGITTLFALFFSSLARLDSSATAFGMQLALGWIVAAFLLLRVSGSASPGILNIDYCVTFWAKNITCYWDLLPETHPPTTYVLHVTEESGRCRRDFGPPMHCVAGPGERSCSVAVENLFAFYKIRLVAESRDGQLSSPEKCVHGMSIVKLSPPVIDEVVANHSRCFQVSWHLPGDEILSASEAQHEIQYRDETESSWIQVNVTVAENAVAFADVCGLFPFNNYSVRVRAKYLCTPSLLNPWGPYWSDWSAERWVQTRAAAPSNGPALWRKLGTPDADGKRAVVLMWKPLEPKQANGEILAYRLYSQKDGEPAVPQCRTRDLQCALSLPARIGHTFLLTASNAAGVSPPSKLVTPPLGEDDLSPIPVLASPVGGNALLLQWSLPSFPEMGYIFEWGPLSEKQDSKVFWHYQPGNVNQAVIKKAIEPGRLYEVRIFALLNGSVWASGSTSGYSKQIAPLRAPVLYPTQVWKTRMKLQWEVLPLAERGGVIRNYSICYKEDGKEEKTVVVAGSVQSCLIEDLRPGSVVRIHITASTEGGTTRGPTLAVLMRSSDDGETETFFSVICVGSLLTLLLVAGSLTCVWKHRKYVNITTITVELPEPNFSLFSVVLPGFRGISGHRSRTRRKAASPHGCSPNCVKLVRICLLVVRKSGTKAISA
ncbi:granulocyte colony-stimulating factor receptor-like isoform X2 [Anolis carolinensis]|uniref:granulocyte colony-stimulating factor receptor-like isoform X2 n=1 Tax=Anolis carolinensis TaxID=28377 RepID=UPI002F2B5047